MKKAIYLSIIVAIIVAIIFTALMFILKYNEKGEENMPFQVTKISLISTIDAQNVEDEDNLWNKNVEQNNDIYIYIEKNPEYEKTEEIKNIKLNNFQVVETPQKGIMKTYRPSINEKEIFENKEEYKCEEITYNGEQSTNIQRLQISNQGGIIAFRSSIQDLGNYTSNDNEINYDELLKKIGIKYDEIKSTVSFDIIISLESGKEFKATKKIVIPVENIIEAGKSSKEFTDLGLVFKRIEN